MDDQQEQQPQQQQQQQEQPFPWLRMTKEEIHKHHSLKTYRGHADEEIYATMGEKGLILCDITVNNKKEIVAMKHDIIVFKVNQFRIPWNEQKRKQFMENPQNQDRVRNRKTAGRLTGKALRNATRMLQTYNWLDIEGEYGSMLVAKHEWTPI